MIIRAEQIRAGRSLAGLKQYEFAELAGLSLATVKRIESQYGPLTSGRMRTVSALLQVLADHAVELFDDPDGTYGVRRKEIGDG